MNDINEKDQVAQIARALLKSKPSPPSRDAIRECVVKAVTACGKEAFDVNSLVLELESLFTVWVGRGTTLDNLEDHIPWLPNKKASISWDFWNRYQTYLEEEKGWPTSVLNRVDELTEQILERLEDPGRPGSWDRRGMVVGQVQSGKTSNYTGLICKAVDAGYKVIVVLAGVHNSLRSQTQLRLDEGLLGRDTRIERRFREGAQPVGAGKIPTRKKLIIHSITTSEEKGDFQKKVAQGFGFMLGGEDPLVLVVKKNKSVLTNLVRWAASTTNELSGKRTIHDVPLLVIDDEADHASINTKIDLDESGGIVDEEEVTAINGLIRQLLKSFEQSAYVGYTATPFANIFIYPNANSQKLSDRYGEDLFPRSFIVNLPAPSNYVGPAKVFGLESDADTSLEGVEGLDILRRVNDQSEWMPVKHKKDHVPPYLPASLKEAVRAFILTCAVRILRGQETLHNSMLIHVTRYTDVQKKVATLVKDEISSLQRHLRYREESSPDSTMKEFETLWKRDFLPTTKSVQAVVRDPAIQPLEWGVIASTIYQAISKIQVKEINGSAKDVLEYFDHKNGLSVIAIGGDKLSRGLTLEGLSVSYFLRASKMYDTLMQMGRWFGYRPGFLDLCRLYTDPELIDWYKHITVASEELRQEFDYMSSIGETPANYGLKVRIHPQGLMITGANKMKTGTEMSLSYAGSLSETTIFYKERDVNWQNYQATVSLLNSIGQLFKEINNNPVWKNVPAAAILDFLTSYKTHEKCRPADTRKLSEYIERQLEHNELISWTVALVSSGNGQPHTIAGHNIGLTTRSEPKDSISTQEYKLRKSHLLNPTDEWIDFSEHNKAIVLQKTRADREKRGKPSAGKTPSGQILRFMRSPQKALLLIYPIDISDVSSMDFDDFPVVGFVVSFPRSEFARRIKYRVNNPYWDEEFGE